MELIVYNKTDSYKLGPHLSLRELRCHCRRKRCTRTLVSLSSIRSYNLTRKYYKKAIRVTSAFRCQAHNAKVGGIENSYHLIGAALDLQPFGDFTSEELDTLQEIAEMYYDVVIRYDSFIHCHNAGEVRTGLYKEQ